MFVFLVFVLVLEFILMCIVFILVLEVWGWDIISWWLCEVEEFKILGILVIVVFVVEFEFSL